MPIRLTRSVKTLLIISFAIFVVQQTADRFFGTQLLSLFSLVPAAVFQKFAVWQLITYSFVHTDVMHLFFNLMMMAFIGSELEATWGTTRFLKYYFFCILSVAFLFLLLQFTPLAGAGLGTGAIGIGIHSAMLGSSGAIYGLLTAYGLIFGDRVLLFMMLFPMKAKHFVWVLGLLEFMTSIYSAGGGAANLAQAGGMIAGFCYIWVRAYLVVRQKKRTPALGSLEQKRLKRRSPSQHLKLVINNPSDHDSLDEHSESDPKTWH